MERDEKLKREAEKRGPDILDRTDSELNEFYQDHGSCFTYSIHYYMFILIGRQFGGPGWFFSWIFQHASKQSSQKWFLEHMHS